MKCLTITEPWGTLIAMGEKSIETRSWRTHYRGEIAIHCAKGMNRQAKEECFKEPYISTIREHIEEGKKTKYNFPLGKVIATANLVDCVQMEELNNDYAILSNGMKVTGNELAFGDYKPGRYAWILEDVKLLETSIPAKGQLGLWNCEVF